MQDGIMTGMAFIITAICTIHQFIHYKTETGLELLKIHTSTGMDQLFYVLIVLGISEFTMMVCYELLTSHLIACMPYHNKFICKIVNF